MAAARVCRRGVRSVEAPCGSAAPCSADAFRQRPAALADHGSALPIRGLADSALVAPRRARRKLPANGPLRSPTMGRRYRYGASRILPWWRRAVLGGRFPPTARCARRPWIGATDTRPRGFCSGSAEPCPADAFRQRPAALADHGSALPIRGVADSALVAPRRARRKLPANGPLRSPTMGRRHRCLYAPRCRGHHEPVEGGAGWVGGGVERHGWRETRPAGAAVAVPRQPTPPRLEAAPQRLQLQLQLPLQLQLQFQNALNPVSSRPITS